MGVAKALGKAAIDLGQQTLKGFAKKGYTKDLAPQVVKSLSDHINITKGVDIPEMETMFKGMKAGDDVAYESFNDFSKTLSASDHYQGNVNKLTRSADTSWVGERKTSELSQAGMRKNMMQYGYAQRQANPDVAPAEMLEGFRQEMGTTAFRGEEQKFVSGGSKPTKKTEISEAGQRKLTIQGTEQNKARRQKNMAERNKHGYTSAEAKKSYNQQNKAVAAENKQAVTDAKAQGVKVKPGQQFVSLEHDIALSHGRKWWKKVGNIGNDSENLFIQRNQLARQFKDNIENWFYPKSKDFVIKSDRSNLKDLIIMNAETGEEVLTIPMPDNFKNGIPNNIEQQLNQLLGR